MQDERKVFSKPAKMLTLLTTRSNPALPKWPDCHLWITDSNIQPLKPRPILVRMITIIMVIFKTFWMEHCHFSQNFHKSNNDCVFRVTKLVATECNKFCGPEILPVNLYVSPRPFGPPGHSWYAAYQRSQRDNERGRSHGKRGTMHDWTRGSDLRFAISRPHLP